MRTASTVFWLSLCCLCLSGVDKCSGSNETPLSLPEPAGAVSTTKEPSPTTKTTANVNATATTPKTEPTQSTTSTKPVKSTESVFSKDEKKVTESATKEEEKADQSSNGLSEGPRDAGLQNKDASQSQEEEQGSSHFFAYLVSAGVLVAVLYITYHNKRKIIAFMLEGKKSRTTRRHKNTDYQMLQQDP